MHFKVKKSFPEFRQENDPFYVIIIDVSYTEHVENNLRDQIFLRELD